jgi:hypothetical protein
LRRRSVLLLLCGGGGLSFADQIGVNLRRFGDFFFQFTRQLKRRAETGVDLFKFRFGFFQ